MATEYKKASIIHTNDGESYELAFQDASYTPAFNKDIYDYTIFLKLKQYNSFNNTTGRIITISFKFYSTKGKVSAIPLWSNNTCDFSSDRMYFSVTTSTDTAYNITRTNFDQVYFVIKYLTDYWWGSTWTLFQCTPASSNYSSGTDNEYSWLDLFDISGVSSPAYIDLYSSALYADYDTNSALVDLWPEAATITRRNSANNLVNKLRLVQNEGIHWVLDSTSFIERNKCSLSSSNAITETSITSTAYNDGKLQLSTGNIITLPTTSGTLSLRSTLYTYNFMFKINKKKGKNGSYGWCQGVYSYTTTANVTSVTSTRSGDNKNITENGVWDSGTAYYWVDFYNDFIKPLFNTREATIRLQFQGFRLWGTKIDFIDIACNGTTRGYGYASSGTNEQDLNTGTTLQVFVTKTKVFSN